MRAEVKQLKLKCFNCGKRATGFVAKKPVCGDCFDLYKLKNKPKKLTTYLIRKARQ